MVIRLYGLSEFQEQFTTAKGEKVDRKVLQCLDATPRGRQCFFDLDVSDASFNGKELIGKEFSVHVGGIQTVFAGHVRLLDPKFVSVDVVEK